MDFKELAKKRFSVRNFSNRPVEQEKLDKMLEMLLLAPTAKNQQPERVYVLQSEEILAKLDELTPCRYGAPVVLLFTYNEGEEWKHPTEEGVHSGIEDVSIVATHVMLQAAELDLDTVWCNFFPNKRLEETLGLPGEERSVVLMPVGYRAENVKPSPMHEATRPLEEMVKRL